MANPPLPTVESNLRNFVGEETTMPTPPAASSAPADPSAWSEQQQLQFMQALMGGAGSTPGGSPLPGMPALPSTPGGGFNFDPAAAGANGSDPLSALMMQFQQQQQPGENAAPAAPPKPPTKLQKLMPLIHLLSVWAMLAFFVIAKEPLAWSNGGGRWGLGWEVDRDGVWWGMLRRWGELGRSAGRGAAGAGIGGYAVQAVDKVQPPMLLSLALPYLPAPLPTVIIHTLKYIKMGGYFLDDVSALIVGVGLLVWIGGWVQQ
ncbi:hypothetical protein HWV62_44225 [Athelia sp. TMB]|nr:hypothetical protein HWV62_42044 [Athelia sp. TMB]KAF7978975.1 hypothetical protein HWV62_44225 [Athelia sp. TMB]